MACKGLTDIYEHRCCFLAQSFTEISIIIIIIIELYNTVGGEDRLQNEKR